MAAQVIPVKLASPDPTILASAAEVIRQGGVIVYPTETVYGIGANAFSRSAVQKVVDAKRRSEGKPILVVAGSWSEVRRLTPTIPPEARKLMDAFWPGPLTLVMRAMANLAPPLTQGTGTIGVRIPGSKFCLSLLRNCGCPLTSTSANISGLAAGTTIEAIHAELGDAVDMYLDAGVLPESAPSTVIDCTRTPLRLIREGAVPLENILRIIPDAQR